MLKIFIIQTALKVFFLCNYPQSLRYLYTQRQKNESTKEGKIVDSSFIYSSENNDEWMSINELRGKIQLLDFDK